MIPQRTGSSLTAPWWPTAVSKGPSLHASAEVNPAAHVSQNSSLLFTQKKTAEEPPPSGLISEISRRFVLR